MIYRGVGVILRGMGSSPCPGDIDRLYLQLGGGVAADLARGFDGPRPVGAVAQDFPLCPLAAGRKAADSAVAVSLGTGLGCWTAVSDPVEGVRAGCAAVGLPAAGWAGRLLVMALAQVVLGSGRLLELSRVRMEETYEGLLMGYPTRQMNDAIVAGAVKQAEKDYPSIPVHLVEPPRVPRELRRATFGPMETLPGVQCTGFFTSGPVDPELDSVLHYSRLVVVWFQASSDLASLEQAAPGLCDVPWGEKAGDEEV